MNKKQQRASKLATFCVSGNRTGPSRYCRILLGCFFLEDLIFFHILVFSLRHVWNGGTGWRGLLIGVWRWSELPLVLPLGSVSVCVLDFVSEGRCSRGIGTECRQSVSECCC